MAEKSINIQEAIESFNGKSREELIFPEIFKVKGVLINSLRTELDVDKYSCPIRKIIYESFANLEKGDKIRAYILKYRTEERSRGSGPIVGGEYLKDKFYFERDFQEEETVEKIEKLNPNDLEEVLATFGC